MPSSLSDVEERESVHWHDCVRCGREWEHGSRRCSGVREMDCEDCGAAVRRAWGEDDESIPF